MRVIAGRLGGRLFESPHTHRTHPMSDKARGALFNILGDIEGLTVLDAFAGTGALSFEAMSRGAASALAIERDRSAQRVISENIRALGLANQVKLVAAPTHSWLQTNQGVQFDIVLADPPHDDLQQSLLAELTAAVRPEGLFVLSWPGSQELPQFENLTQLEMRSYGDMQLGFYRAA